MNQTSVINYVNKDSGAKITLKQPVYTAGEPWKAMGLSRNPIYVFSNIENTKELIRDDEDGVVIEPKVNGETVTIKDNTFTIPAGGVTIKNLQTSDTEYAIVEVDSPDGYVITNDTPVKFKVTSGELTDKTMIAGVEYASEGNDFIIPNTPGAALPNTGGPGTRLFTILGSILILGAGLMLWRKHVTI